MSVTRIRLMIVDDHKVVRAGLRQLLEEAGDIEIVGEAGSAAEALACAAGAKPDVALLDLRLGDAQGAEVCRELKRRFPELRALALTSYLDDETVLNAVAAGVDGYLLKEIDGPDLAVAIRRVAAGGACLDPRVARKLIEQVKPALNPLGKLTLQERKLVGLIAEGKTNKEIGVELGLGEKTVRNYLTAVMQKLNVKRRSEAAVLHERFAGTGAAGE